MLIPDTQSDTCACAQCRAERPAHPFRLHLVGGYEVQPDIPPEMLALLEQIDAAAVEREEPTHLPPLPVRDE